MRIEADNCGYHQYASIDDIIRDKISSSSSSTKSNNNNNNVAKGSFYVASMFDIYERHQQWLKWMPNIKPFYAVKCNDLPEILQFLTSLGVNFDCSSKREIEQVLACGAQPDQIMYGNPCKTNVSIKHAKAVDVKLTTFDNELELHKCARLHKQAKLVLRVETPSCEENNERCEAEGFKLSIGAKLDKCYSLLKLALQLELDVVGVSFHTGSNCTNPRAYCDSIAVCREVFDMGDELGHQMRVLDIGGGFSADPKARVSFETIAMAINDALNAHFPSGKHGGNKIEFIAEPGRFYVSSCMTLVSKVIGKRVESSGSLMGGSDDHETPSFVYCMNEGVYGAFSNVMYENAQPEPEMVFNGRGQCGQVGAPGDCERLCSSVMWGPTEDSRDCIRRDFMFPELHVGDWVLFRNMGAYNCCIATTKSANASTTGMIIADNISDKRSSFIHRTNKQLDVELVNMYLNHSQGCQGDNADDDEQVCPESNSSPWKEFRFLKARNDEEPIEKSPRDSQMPEKLDAGQ